MKILLMGVSGSGKSLLGQALARELGIPFFDGDDFHSPQNVAKMTSGQPLRDEDRQPWLQRLGRLVQEQPHLVLACSALRRAYRQLLLGDAIDSRLRVCYLQGRLEVIWQRMETRATSEGHFFSGRRMLESQFASLEEPGEAENPIYIPVELSPKEQLALLLSQLRQ